MSERSIWGKSVLLGGELEHLKYLIPATEGMVGTPCDQGGQYSVGSSQLISVLPVHV